MIQKLLSFAAILALSGSILAAGSETFTVGSITFKKPASWTPVQPASSMRSHQFSYTHPETKGEVEIAVFPGLMGGSQANVDRWIGQFENVKDKKVDHETLGAAKVVYVFVEGTYKSGMPGSGITKSLAEHALLGAIVEHPDSSMYIKITGPQAAAKSTREDFKKMIEDGLKK